jgi:hypothetical protein
VLDTFYLTFSSVGYEGNLALIAVPLIVAKVFSVSHANAEFPEIIFTPLL